jgi:ACS family hexuronate transporter-like MFS transporter
LRILLGFWESVNFPISIMIIARIFPPRERSLATGIFTSGAFLATLAAPPFVIYFSSHYNWRYSFVFAGLLGLLWLIPWNLIFRDTERRCPDWERLFLRSEPEGQRMGVLASLIAVAGKPGFWGVALMGLGIVPSLYFATQWFPSFFTQQLQQPYDQALAFKLSMIYLMQDVGLWVGGAVVLWLSGRGVSILRSRKVVVSVAISLMMGVVLIPQLTSVNWCVVVLCIYVMGIGAFLGSQHAFKQDIDARQTATVSALVGGIETGFAAVVVKRVGVITNETADFTPVFVVLVGLALFGLLVVQVFVRPKWYRIE